MSVRRLFQAALIGGDGAGGLGAVTLCPSTGDFKFTEGQVIGSTVGKLTSFSNAVGGIATATVTAGALPSGLSVAFTAAPTTSGIVYLTGTVGIGTTGNFSFTITVTSVGGQVAAYAGLLEVTATDVLQVQPAVYCAQFTQGTPVNVTVTDWVYDDINNTGLPAALGLPPGLQFSSTDPSLSVGTISITGTPTTQGVYSNTSDFTSTSASVATLTWRITVVAGGSSLQASIGSYTGNFSASQNLGSIVIGTFINGPVTSTTIISGSAGGTITFSCDAAVNSGNIYINGSVGAAGTYTGTFRISDGVDVVDIPFTLNVAATFSVTPGSMPRSYYTGMTVGTGGTIYDTIATYANSGGTVTWVGGSVPAGTTISIQPTTGTTGNIRLVGTPTVAGVVAPTLSFSSPNGIGNFNATFNVAAGGNITSPLGLNGTTKVDQAADGVTTLTVLSLYPNGSLAITTNNSGNLNGTWFSPDVSSIEGSKHWVRFTLTGVTGTTNGGYVNSTGWEALTAQRLVYITGTNTNNAQCTANYTVEVAADAAGTQIVSTGYYGLGIYNVTPTPPPSGAPVNPIPGNGGTYEWTVFSGGVTVRLILNPDGTMQIDHQPPLTVFPGFPANWYFPTTGGIGNSYWARYTYTGTVPNVGVWTPNVWTPLSSSLITGYNRSSTGTSSGTMNVQIASDAGGLNVVSSGTIILVAVRDII